MTANVPNATPPQIVAGTDNPAPLSFTDKVTASAAPTPAVPTQSPSTTEKDANYEAREALVKPLGTLLHHMLAHSGVLPKLESKEENAARRTTLMNQIASLIHQRPAKTGLDGLITRYGNDALPHLLKASHDTYENLGGHQTVAMMKKAGLDLGELKQSAAQGAVDLEHILGNIENLVIVGSPSVTGNLLNAQARSDQTLSR